MAGTRPLTESLGYGYTCTCSTNLDLPITNPERVNDGARDTGQTVFQDETQGAGYIHRTIAFSWPGPVRIDALSCDLYTEWGYEQWPDGPVEGGGNGAWTMNDDGGWDIPLVASPETWTPDTPIHGTTLTLLWERTLTGLSYVGYQRINEIVRGKRGITSETAWLLAQALDTTPEFWINLQATYDLALSRPTKTIQPLRMAS